MAVKAIHNPEEGALRAVGLMSGSGTNLRKILEYQELIKEREGKYLYQLVAIFSDNYQSRAGEIGKDFELPVIVHDIDSFYKKRGAPKSDLKLREEFDRLTVKMLSVFKAKVAVYGGYMSLATQPLISAFIGVNVHPADLSIEEAGKRKWTGGHAVRDQILAGEKYLCSTTHLIEPECDLGKIFMISNPIEAQVPEGANLKDLKELQKISDQNQERLKESGDWVIFPKTIEEIAKGNFQTDEKRNFYYRGKRIPKGIRLSELK